jgi:hypothetical protein
VATTDNVVEHEADEHPGHVVQRRRNRNEPNATEDDWEVEIPQKRLLIRPLESPLDDWGNSTCNEEDRGIVQLTVGEDTL